MYHSDMGSLAQFAGEQEYDSLSLSPADDTDSDWSDPEDREVMQLAMSISAHDRIRALEREITHLRERVRVAEGWDD